MPTGGPRLRALLTALAMAGGRAVSTGSLAARVWPGEESAPDDELAALQALVGRLRRALGRDAVASGAGGYRLVVERDDIDLFRFERLAGEGSGLLAGGEPAKAADLLDEALALWHGPVFADLPDGGGAAGVRARERWLSARRTRLAAELELGRAEQALPAVRELAAEHPLDERAQLLHVRALRDAGRPAEALEAYESVRRDLAARLGTDPGPELRALHAELLRGGGDGAPSAALRCGQSAPGAQGGHSAGPHPRRDRTPAPESGAPARDPLRGTAAPAVGAGRGGLAGAVPGVPTRSAPAERLPTPPAGGGERREGGADAPPRGNVRVPLTSFVGREEELRAIAEELPRARLLTLTGPGGAGKTRLSLEAATAAAPDAWPDGVWVAELAPVRTEADTDATSRVAETVLTALGGRETVVRPATAEVLAADPHAHDPLAQLAERCAQRRMLLVLDNCEHLIDAAAALAETLLTACPGVTVLATSREPLGVPGETVRPVDPLPAPVSLRLLADRGAAARPGFRTEDDPETCAEICRRLDGLPLAVELAAARLRALTPRQLADRLDDRFRVLTSGARTALPRQQTLRAVVDWSWDLLEEPERAVLRRLSVFSGGCALEQAEEVCSGEGPGEEPADTAALLASLVDKSLVVATPVDPYGDGGMRYHLLETVAEYAAERLAEEEGERAAAERRHLTAYRELARTTDPLLRGPDQVRAMALLEREHDNIRTALRRAVAARDEQEGLVLVHAMAWFWQLRDHRADSRGWADAVAALGPDPFAGPVAGPVPAVYEQCTDSPPPLGDDVLAEARRGVALMRIAAAQDAIAAESPESSAWGDTLRVVAASYEPGQPQVCRLPGAMWIFAWMTAEGFPGMRRVLDASVEGCRAHGYDWDLAFTLQMRTKMTQEQPGAMEAAGRDADESLEIFARLGDGWGEAEALSGQGEVAMLRGEYDRAAAAFARAVERAGGIGAHQQMPMLRSRLGSALAESADPREAARGGELLRAAAEELEDARGESPNFSAIQYAVHLGRRGETDRAREWLEPQEAHFRDREPALFCGIVQGALAWLHCLDGSYAEALATSGEALRRMHTKLGEMLVPNLLLSQLPLAAWASAALGGAEDGAALLGAHDAHNGRPEGYRLQPHEQQARDAAERAVREALGERDFARAYAKGGGLSLEEATALVHRAVRERAAG